MNTMNAYSSFLVPSLSTFPTSACALCLAALACATACDLGDENLGESGGSDGDALVCEMPDDPPALEQTTVRITNATAGPIWLPGAICPGVTRLRLTVDGIDYVDEAGDYQLCSLKYDAEDDDYWCVSGCEGDDMVRGTVRIGAGESFEMPWANYGFTRVPIEAPCQSPDGFCTENSGCYVGREIPLGSQVSIRVDASGECFGGTQCDCADPNDETCGVPTASPGFGPTDLSGTADFELTPGFGTVEVVISS
ncbi:hypothetical protein PPSIR1_29653 [Plesiocystis pacifica SIR-1]|uniref:Lipoprotein n=1 Tax=Plesiocystis pacifica SIR-1 TaxID=391625 RepID=A6G698_9BACT|nr:hypothetical protein [Plesiocystis pacifica]EDM78700.1 hypothetical protein PPSIR1_29653 [Plesiocystis pacifica SIR-1]